MMEAYIKAAGIVLIGLIVGSLLSVRDRSFASLLTMGICTLVLLIGFQYLAPVMDFLRQLEELGCLEGDMVKILLKACGVGILTEVTALLCADSGNASFSQSLRILSAAVILWMSLPIFQALLDLIREILGGF